MSARRDLRGGLPGRLARGAGSFIDPPLKVGRIPYGRTVLVLLVIAALTFLAYTLVKKDFLVPFISNPYYVQVAMPDAQGLNPAKEPAAGVAGVDAGRVVDVEVTRGTALVTLRLESDMRGKIFNNASAVVRPTSVLQTLIVNVLPGDPAAGVLPDGKPIPIENTRPFVHIDELTGLLDADTQAQVQVLIEEAALALRGREPELRRILDKLGRLTDVSTPVAQAVAERHRLLAQLTGQLDLVFETFGQRREQLARVINTGSRTLEVTSGRETELASATRQLGPVLSELQGALAATRSLSEPLIPALDELLPVARELDPTAEELKELNPALDRVVRQADDLVDEGKKPLHQLAGGLKGLPGRIQKDQIPALEELLDLSDLLYKYRNGFIQFAENFSGLASVNRNSGTWSMFSIVNLELDPGDLGVSQAAARSRNGEPSKMATMLSKALEYTCRDNPIACLLRFQIPGLPTEPLLNPEKGEGG